MSPDEITRKQKEAQRLKAAAAAQAGGNTSEPILPDRDQYGNPSAAYMAELARKQAAKPAFPTLEQAVTAPEGSTQAQAQKSLWEEMGGTDPGYNPQDPLNAAPVPQNPPQLTTPPTSTAGGSTSGTSGDTKPSGYRPVTVEDMLLNKVGSSDAGGPPKSNGIDLAGIAGWLGKNAGGFLNRLGQGFANAGGTGQYSQGMQDLQRQLQANELATRMALPGIQSQANIQQSAGTLPYQEQLQQNQGNVETGVYGTNLGTYFKNLPNYMRLMQSMYGTNGTGPMGAQTSAGAWAQNPNYSTLLQPGSVGNLSVNPQQDFSNQMRQLDFMRSTMPPMPGAR